jgi:uncharacterized protein (DUF1499 family)
MRKKAAAMGLAGLGLGYGLWRGWEAGLDRTWQGVFGPPDLGPVDFAALRRRSSPNDALICPRAFCPDAPDSEPPVFALAGARLRALVSEAALADPGVTLVQTGPKQDRYLARTRLMRYPDTIVAEVIEQGPNLSTLALYSRSQIGRSDFGVNRRRIERWVERIGALAAREQGLSGR